MMSFAEIVLFCLLFIFILAIFYLLRSTIVMVNTKYTIKFCFVKQKMANPCFYLELANNKVLLLSAGLYEDWLPFVDDYRTFCASNEAEKLCKKLLKAQ